MTCKYLKHIAKSSCLVSHLVIIVVYLMTVGFTTVLYAFQADFKPFVTVDLIDTCEILNKDQEIIDPVPVIYTGTVTHVNKNGQAVGWVQLDNQYGDVRAFFFEPGNRDDTGEEVDVATWGLPQMTLLPFPTGTSFAEAHGIQTDQSSYQYRLPSVVGVVAIDEENDTVALKWSWNESLGEWQWQSISGIGNKPSYAYAVDSLGYIVGSLQKNGENWDTSYVYDDVNGLRHPANYPKGVARDIEQQFDRNAVGTFVDTSGEDHAYIWNIPWSSIGNLTDLHPAGPDESGANAISGDYVVGWLSPTGGFRKPALWDDQGASYWTVYPLPGTMLSSQAYDINYDSANYGNVDWSGDIVISIDDTAETSGAAIWKRNLTTGINYAYELQDLVLLADYDPEGDALVHRAFSINDNGWIGGSYKPDGAASMPLPALFIPYDTDNNGTPDYREIIVGGGPGMGVDANTNPSGRSWLLDLSEDMRPSIYAAGMNGTNLVRGNPPNNKEGSHTLLINNVQIVRHTVKSKAINNFWQGELNQECTDLSLNISEWGLGIGADGTYGTDLGKEIVLTYRSVDDSLEEDHEFDYVPLEGSQERADKLHGLYHMAYRLSRCIDYIQFGNEHWAGSGSLLIDGEKINLLSETELGIAIDQQVKPWYREQAKVARVASALAGRPLRLITSGLIGGIVDEAANGGNARAEKWINFLVNEFANPNELIVDLHMHYIAVGEVNSWIQSMTTPPLTRWESPNHLGVLEWSPVVNTDQDPDTWYTGARERHEKYYTSGSGQKPWNLFIREWEGGQYYPDGFEMSNVLDTMELSGILMGCYGATNQGGTFLDIYWDMAALRADAVLLEYLDDIVDRFTTLKDGLDGANYEGAAQAYLVGTPQDPFEPHPAGCPCKFVCEGCVDPLGQ